MLREKWSKENDPKNIISELSVYQNVFVDILSGQNTQGHNKEFAERLLRQHRLGAPNSTFPFFMQMSNAVVVGDLDESVACQVLDLVESFLVRRAVCGVEPTGLHAVFKKLWGDVSSKVSVESVGSAIRGHSTVIWPDNHRFAEAVARRPLYKAAVSKFVIQEFNRSQGGDVPSEVPWIEHVLPQKMSESWEDDFTEAEHQEWVDTLPNLLPLSEAMNRELSNGPYSRKRRAFLGDSMFKSTRDFAALYDTWTPAQLRERAEALAAWAIERWRY